MKDNAPILIKLRTSNISICAVSDTGRHRSENQDALFFDEVGRFMLLADGMGGHERGAEASQTALSVMKEYFHPDVVSSELQDITEGSGVPPEIICLMSLVDEAVNKANAILYERNQKEKLQRFMGTTIVGLIFDRGGNALWFHVGDSRLYRWRKSNLKRLTADHSAYTEWIRKGREGTEPGKNVVTRAIGPNPAVSAEALWEKWEQNDIYLLCSDGLTDMISDEQIAHILKSEHESCDIASRLIKAANDAGGKDNVSVIVCIV